MLKDSCVMIRACEHFLAAESPQSCSGLLNAMLEDSPEDVGDRVYFKSRCKFNFRGLPRLQIIFRGGSRTAAASKVELFEIIVNGWKP